MDEVALMLADCRLSMPPNALVVLIVEVSAQAKRKAFVFIANVLFRNERVFQEIVKKMLRGPHAGPINKFGHTLGRKEYVSRVRDKTKKYNIRESLFYLFSSESL